MKVTYHSPKEPAPEIMETLRAYTIDTKKGIVYGKKGLPIFKHVNGKGYHDSTIYGSGIRRILSRAHVIWWAATGEWPKYMLDHRDRNRTNDAINNLRYSDCTRNRLNSQQCIARTLPTGVQPSGCKTRPYRAQYRKDEGSGHIGHFKTPGEAHQAYLQHRE